MIGYLIGNKYKHRQDYEAKQTAVKTHMLQIAENFRRIRREFDIPAMDISIIDPEHDLKGSMDIIRFNLKHLNVELDENPTIFAHAQFLKQGYTPQDVGGRIAGIAVGLIGYFVGFEYILTSLMMEIAALEIAAGVTASSVALSETQFLAVTLGLSLAIGTAVDGVVTASAFYYEKPKYDEATAMLTELDTYLDQLYRQLESIAK